MSAVDDTRLYTIGELARRTGLSVKTIRFYSDQGVVPPTDRTYSGYRLYDVEAISRLELVRTLRELGAGLAEVRRVVATETTVSGLAKAHLDLVERQLRALRTRRAVLRAVVKQNSTTDEVKLMHKLANMSDEERNRLIDDFWDEVMAGLNLDDSYVQRLRSARPRLPEDPSTEQLEAWIELAELVQQRDFRDSIRAIYQEMSARRAPDNSAPPQLDQAEVWGDVMTEVRAAADETAPDSKRGRELAERVGAMFAAQYGRPNDNDLRTEIAGRFESDWEQRLERYWVLLATINGWPTEQQLLGSARPWIVTALRASAR